MLDVVGNNIANVNTTGYKSSSVIFQDLLSQTMVGAGITTDQQGGTNPAQVGLGSGVGAIQTAFTQGALENTAKSTDVAIQGDGFFVAMQNGKQVFTRAGAFSFDALGNMVTIDGSRVQGWTANPTTHVIDTSLPIGNLTMPPGQLIAPVKTNNITIGRMLSADAAIGDTKTTSIAAYDTQGIENNLKFTFTKTAVNQWSCAAVDNTNTAIGNVAITFDPITGNVTSPSPAEFSVTPTVPAANWPSAITVSFGVPGEKDSLQEFGGLSTVVAMTQDGAAVGTLQSFNVANDGTVTGVYSNGHTEALGKIALAAFNNPGGLEKAGDNFYRSTPNSGVALIGPAGTGGRGTFAAGRLEMSNVDLSQEFTKLIIAQRGFQANSKVITTSDEVLQTLLAMK